MEGGNAEHSQKCQSNIMGKRLAVEHQSLEQNVGDKVEGGASDHGDHGADTGMPKGMGENKLVSSGHQHDGNNQQ